MCIYKCVYVHMCCHANMLTRTCAYIYRFIQTAHPTTRRQHLPSLLPHAPMYLTGK